MTVDILSAPHIYLLEDVTGAGKTEAAMMLTYRLMALAHGNKKLVDEFALSILPQTKSENDTDQIDETALARCSAWLADYRSVSTLLLRYHDLSVVQYAVYGVPYSAIAGCVGR
ncbi:hypothetical protein FK216_12705 [Moraxellaceae bacterium AER2_44_116]|nr:hypothetical protein [Moraxellaceae bacterium]TQC96121.1 hypothetical protein FK216_12705 [Moraxellaceae bacterium AER2_44_116]